MKWALVITETYRIVLVGASEGIFILSKILFKV
jgi:hypothetical protein